MTMTREKIERMRADMQGVGDHCAWAFRVADLRPLLALAERALEPQGQALPDDGELSLDQLMKVFDMGLGFALCHRDFIDTRNAIKKLQADFKVIQQRASQLALPAGPVPEGWKMVPIVPTKEMGEAHLSHSMEGWEEQYAAMLHSAPSPSKENMTTLGTTFVVKHYGDDVNPLIKTNVGIYMEVHGGTREIADEIARRLKSNSGEDCPRCDGSGEEEVMDSDGPDAHPIMVNCTHCGGVGSLSAAYKHLLSELAAANSKYLEACGKIYFPGIEPSPAVAQPVADENELWDLLDAVDEALDRKAVPHAWVSYARTAGHEFIMKRRAALCQPAEEGDKA